MIERIGSKYLTTNIEGGEYSYVVEAGSKAKLEKALGHKFNHFKLDIRFEDDDFVLLVETKQNFVDDDIKQLEEYLEEENALHPDKKVVCILANTKNDKIKVWKSVIDEDHFLSDETVLDTMEHYKSLFYHNKQNDRERVLKNTYALNELLHKKDIDEVLRSQFVGTVLLHIKDLLKRLGAARIDEALKRKVNDTLKVMSATQIIAGIKGTLTELLDGSDNKAKKIELLQKNVLDNQKIKALTQKDWTEIIDSILMDIYKYIDTNSSEGQDILNLFFIAFNKYTGKADKNQAFTPDHITEFMCRLTEVDCTKVVLDGTCGSASFLVQAMVKELSDCLNGRTEEQAKALQKTVKENNIYGIEVEEKAFGLSVTNMLIHGDGNSNIKPGSCFDKDNRKFIKEADPNIILMNPPYNAKPRSIPDSYKSEWGKAKDGKEDPTKGLVFVHYFSDVIKELNTERIKNGKQPKPVKLAVLLPLACAIGTGSLITKEKEVLLEDNTLEAVFSLPAEIFYPGSSVCACCMLFTLGQPHVKPDGTTRPTFFGYCKDDGFVKKKNLGRVEQFIKDEKGNSTISKWKQIENEWLDLFERKAVVDGKSAVERVNSDDEWLCEAYMKTDYTKLTADDFQRTLNNYLSYLVKEGNVYESNNEA
ncbi:MAG: SAM-dependent methyltransferase [Candidatus Gastranaerophilales bacterium]|nr:SAM-dependent methyltransferase [Candidatus Gastranaerophilales bacterium]